MAQPLRWGIVGTGMIAGVFAKGLAQAKRGVRAAVASRNPATAQAFAAAQAIPKAYGSYGALLADPEVDAVYVATPHPCHREVVLAAAAAGKHVLCEKPMGVTPHECREMIAAAEAAGVVLLEAFMYRVHPQTVLIQETLAKGRIGRPKLVRSSFCYGMGDGAYNVRLDKSLRGGGLYDVGCYCINFSRMVAGEEPDDVAAVWTVGEKTGVDESLAAALHFPSGLVAQFDVCIRCAGSAFAEVVGTDGSLWVSSPWRPHPERAVVELRGKGPMEPLTVTDGGHVFPLEADHLAAVVQDGAAPLIPAANAVGNAAVMDAIWQRMHKVG